LPVFILNWNLGDEFGNKMSTRNVIARKEYLEIPSPDADTMSWARYPILSDDGTNPAQFRYVERAYTRGGQPPASCGGKATIQVPYEAYYYFYPCKDPKQAAEAPKEQPKETPAPTAVEAVAPVEEPVVPATEPTKPDMPTGPTMPTEPTVVPESAPVKAVEDPMAMSPAPEQVVPTTVPTAPETASSAGMAGVSGAFSASLAAMAGAALLL
jgi:hypothetical protein